LLDPLIDDLNTTLIARNRYRGCRVMLTVLTAVINFTLVSAPNPQVKQVNE
jgi:hypothetical protein